MATENDSILFISFTKENPNIIPASIRMTFSPIINRMMKKIAEDESIVICPETFCNATICPSINKDIIEIQNWKGKFVCFVPNDEKPGSLILFEKIFSERATYFTDHKELLAKYPSASIERPSLFLDVYKLNRPQTPSPCPSPIKEIPSPSVIISDKLFLGGVDCPESFLESIDNVVSIVPSQILPDFAKKFINEGKHLHIPICDDFSPNIFDHSEKFVNFVSTALERNESVYVHCYAGKSRSVTFMILYFMEKNNMSYEEAEKFVKECRKCASPNLHFCGSLLIYGEWLKSDRKLSANEFSVEYIKQMERNRKKTKEHSTTTKSG